jgi:hypothetical protein
MFASPQNKLRKALQVSRYEIDGETRTYAFATAGRIIIRIDRLCDASKKAAEPLGYSS